MQYGQQIQVAWRKQPVFIIRHTQESLQNIDAALPKLADPNSDQIEEPYKGMNPTRSKSSEYTVIAGVCTHLGCSPKYHPKVEPKPWDASWAGGFFCPCHGSMFDMVGRVYKGVPAPTNLPVPPPTHSGSKPCKQSGSGEFPIGISWPGRAIKIIKAGAPMEMIIPEEGIGWEMQVVAIMKGTKNLEDSKRLIDWTLGRGMELFGERQSIIADTSKITPDPELPNFFKEVNAKLIDNKFAWAAANKDRIVKKWKERYDGKTEPKK